MPGAVRLNDTCSGHDDFGSRPNNQASTDVFVNGRGAHRQGDSWAVHCNPVPSCHGGNAANGSPNVFVNGKPMCRIGDSVNCGSTMVNGSSNVFVN
ncbi:PAAR motif of membran proteins [Bacillus phage G]|uniref:Gp118 n=1 Tax=Bacillus phage G TaxID=2884420 RepID=G3MBI0_9CAUD|nr:PAAR motif of membran proteins [Bacillus phage G]AEO93380.1 gp118 [Bacillus phage G]